MASVRGAGYELSNGHVVESLLFVSVCLMLRNVAVLRKSAATSEGYWEPWSGHKALKEFWRQCAVSDHKMSDVSGKLLFAANLCNQNGTTTENIRNIILSLVSANKKGEIVMTIPAPEMRGPADPVPADIELNFGPPSNAP